jgi:prepilin-type N-terminal cleavage/methylation domain-containing protein
MKEYGVMHPHARRNQAGFSLVEVLIAIAILLFGIAAVIRMFPLSLTNTQQAAQRTVVSELADTSLNRLRAAGAEHVWETVARLRGIYDMYLTDATMDQFGRAGNLYDNYWTRVTPMRGAQDTFLQRITFTVELPDERQRTFVTYVSEQ